MAANPSSVPPSLSGFVWALHETVTEKETETETDKHGVLASNLVQKFINYRRPLDDILSQGKQRGK